MRYWKVGALTGGILLIAIGLLWLLQDFLPYSFAGLLLYSWPFICIFLGIEMIVFHYRSKDHKLSVHWFSIILLVVVGVLSFGFYAGKTSIEALGFSFHTTTYEVDEIYSISKPVNEIVITLPDEDIYINGTDEEAIDVSGTLGANIKNEEALKEKVDENFTIKQVGNKVYIEMMQSDFELNDATDIRGRLSISLPKNVNLNIQEAKSINIDNVTGTAYLRKAYGDIAVTNLKGKLVAKTNDGNILISNSYLLGGSKVETGYGHITLDLTKEQSAFLDAYTKSGEFVGNVDWKKTAAASENERKRATTQLGKDTLAVMLSSVGGDISVNK
ncbi:MAG: hypothetical protein K0S51_1074 [Bacillales bacterium]|jgi:hypothetical protein|nr:hypothetical protein [Bacillales bacterium]